MQRVTVTLDDDLVADLDRFMEARGYQNRSETIRDLARAGMQQAIQDTGDNGDSVGALVYVYDHEVRELAKRLVNAHHDHHDISLCTTHVHLDHESCLEVVVLRGPTKDVRHFAEHVIAERGVRHGQLVLVPVEIGADAHAHNDKEPPRPHEHVRVRHTS
jgi:CopG family transcriptional regulator, nickel-responsive regulator